MSKKTILTLISAFCLTLTPVTTNAKTNKINKPITTTTQEPAKRLLKGDATYYGSTYKTVRRTASGEIFNKNLFTAAHKTLPFGTKVKVTNLKNNKTVIVTINDRGPFGKGRIIDLSVAAAKELDMIRSGVVPVTVEIIK